MRKAIKAHKNLHTNQQNEHNPEEASPELQNRRINGPAKVPMPSKNLQKKTFVKGETFVLTIHRSAIGKSGLFF